MSDPSSDPDATDIELNKPSSQVPAEPDRATGATASERASAQVASQLSGRGPTDPPADSGKNATAP